MVYRVVRTENNCSAVYDFDDIEDAQNWISQEKDFDKGYENTVVVDYKLFEVK